MTRIRMWLPVLALVLLCACLGRVERDDVFDVDKVPFGQPVASLSAVYGQALKAPSSEKLAGFQHPAYHLAAMLNDVYSGTVPYDVYFVADHDNIVRMVIMLTRSPYSLEGERAATEVILTRRYGQPVERPEPLRMPGLTMQQIFWSGNKLNVVQAYAARTTPPAAHGETAAHGEAAAHGEQAGEAHGEAAGAHGEAAMENAHGEEAAAPAAESAHAEASKPQEQYGLFVIYEAPPDK